MDKYEESALRTFILKEIVEITSDIADWSSEGMDGRDLAKLIHKAFLKRFEDADRKNKEYLEQLKTANQLQGRIKGEF